MKNKCPNCGFEYDDNDAYCSMCGIKLPDLSDDDSSQKDTDSSDDKMNDSKEVIMGNMDYFASDEKQETNKDPYAVSLNPFADSAVFSFALSMIFISLFLWGVVFVIIQNHNENKARVEYTRMMSNPEKMPLLVEPTSYNGLKTNLADVERFLYYYLKYSKDPQEKKEQIFISYLKEMDKLPYITTENFINNVNYCSAIGLNSSARTCTQKLNKEYEDVGIITFSDYNTIYLYPDYRFIYKKYKRFLSDQLAAYLKLKAKHYLPVSVGLNVLTKPSKIADEIYEFESLYMDIRDTYVRNEILKTIYDDVRVFIFSPSIYSTTTQEMSSDFKRAYKNFVSSRRKSQLRPLIQSYLEKQKSYSEENFKNDYPYEVFENREKISIDDYTLQDVFATLRKKAFDKTALQTSDFRYVYSIISGNWKKFDKNTNLAQGEYALTSVDDDNTCRIYDSKLSLLQDLNVPKNTKSFIANGTLVFYNADRLQLSKVVYNGRNFSLQLMNTSDVSSMFAGINIIYIDSYQDYVIDVSKVNEKETYIILSRYMNGFENYKISVAQGKAATSSLSNMFAVLSNDDAVLLFKDSSVSDQETSENAPTYKIYVKTLGYTNSDRYVNDNNRVYDDKAKYDTEDYTHSPNMMPKIIKEEPNKEKAQEDTVKIDIENVPSQQIEPPSDED